MALSGHLPLTAVYVPWPAKMGRLSTDGTEVATRSLVWCVGVRPETLFEGLDVPTVKGRVTVDEYLTVPGHPELIVCGDIAAVPDPARPGELCAMTAQHAQRQGVVAGRNVAASLGYGEQRPYRHRGLGFVVDLGGVKAAANPLGIPLSGFPAFVVTRGYHLMAMPGNRIRVAVDWLLDALLPKHNVQLGLVRSGAVPLDSADPGLPTSPARRTGRSGGALTRVGRTRPAGLHIRELCNTRT